MTRAGQRRASAGRQTTAGSLRGDWRLTRHRHFSVRVQAGRGRKRRASEPHGDSVTNTGLTTRLRRLGATAVEEITQVFEVKMAPRPRPDKRVWNLQSVQYDTMTTPSKNYDWDQPPVLQHSFKNHHLNISHGDAQSPIH